MSEQVQKKPRRAKFKANQSAFNFDDIFEQTVFNFEKLRDEYVDVDGVSGDCYAVEEKQDTRTVVAF